MIFGYARVSTDDQNLSLQIDALTHYGIDVFCKTFLHNIAKKKYTPLRLKFFSDYCGFDRAFLSR
jgi:DNA invertase Pin-like site-specific DNA recombinase